LAFSWISALRLLYCPGSNPLTPLSKKPKPPLCLYALEHHVDRLADDHLLAASLARRLSSYEGIKRVLPVETNIIILDLEDDGPDAAWLVSAMRMHGVLIGAFGARRLRIVTHLDVDEAGGDALCASMRRQLTAKRMSAV